MIKIHYKIPYRMLEGFTRFFLEQMKRIAKVPSYSLTCKRAKHMACCLPKLSSCRPISVIVNAIGIKVQGEGEWKVKVHGKGRPRKWIKPHVALMPEPRKLLEY